LCGIREQVHDDRAALDGLLDGEQRLSRHLLNRNVPQKRDKKQWRQNIAVEASETSARELTQRSSSACFQLSPFSQTPTMTFITCVEALSAVVHGESCVVWCHRAPSSQIERLPSCKRTRNSHTVHHVYSNSQLLQTHPICGSRGHDGFLRVGAPRLRQGSDGGACTSTRVRRSVDLQVRTIILPPLASLIFLVRRRGWAIS
jgi:hypothetical protein